MEMANANRDRSSDQSMPDDPFKYMDIAPAYREEVTLYGKDRMALPCGGSALVLIYRRDAFERKENIAAAKEKGLKLEAPTTWVELDALSHFFQGRDWDGDGTRITGSLLFSATIPRAWATRSSWHGPPAWAIIPTISRSSSIPRR